MKMSSGVVATTLTAVTFIIIFILDKTFVRHSLEELESFKKTYTFKDGVLSITKRDARFANVIRIERYYSAKLAYKPEKYVYTGATVGSVTTGGIHKEGGYYISTTRSDEYELVYCELGGKKETISAIQLTPKLVEEAKRYDQIGDYLHENRIRIWHPRVCFKKEKRVARRIKIPR